MFLGVAGGVGVCYFWPKLAVWAGSGVFWRFWPVSGDICPGLLCTVGVGDFFPVFWDGGRLRRLGRDSFFGRGGLLYLGGVAGAAPKCDFFGRDFFFFFCPGLMLARVGGSLFAGVPAWIGCFLINPTILYTNYEVKGAYSCPKISDHLIH